MGLFNFAKSSDGSAFAKVSVNDGKLQGIKGRIAALDAANLAHHTSASLSEKEAVRVHAETDAVNARLDSVLASL